MSGGGISLGQLTDSLEDIERDLRMLYAHVGKVPATITRAENRVEIRSAEAVAWVEEIDSAAAWGWKDAGPRWRVKSGWLDYGGPCAIETPPEQRPPRRWQTHEAVEECCLAAEAVDRVLLAWLRREINNAWAESCC